MRYSHERFPLFFGRVVYCSVALFATQVVGQGWDSSDRDVLNAINSGVGAIVDNTGALNVDGIANDLEILLNGFGYGGASGQSFHADMSQLKNYIHHMQSILSTNVGPIKTDLSRFVNGNYNNAIWDSFTNVGALDALNALFLLSSQELLSQPGGVDLVTPYGLLFGWPSNASVQSPYPNGIYGMMEVIQERAETISSYTTQNHDLLAAHLNPIHSALDSVTNSLLNISYQLSPLQDFSEGSEYTAELFLETSPGMLTDPYNYSLFNQGWMSSFNLSQWLPQDIVNQYERTGSTSDRRFYRAGNERFFFDTGATYSDEVGNQLYKFYGNWWATNLTQNVSNNFENATIEAESMPEEELDGLLEEQDTSQDELNDKVWAMNTNAYGKVDSYFNAQTNSLLPEFNTNVVLSSVNLQQVKDHYLEWYLKQGSTLMYDFSLNGISTGERDLLSGSTAVIESKVKPFLNLVLKYALYFLRVLVVVSLVRESFRAVALLFD